MATGMAGSRSGARQRMIVGHRGFYLHEGFGGRTDLDGIWAPPVRLVKFYNYYLSGFPLSEDMIKKTTVRTWGLSRLIDTGMLELVEEVFVPRDRDAFVSLLTIKNKSRGKRVIELGIGAELEQGASTSFDEVRGCFVTDLDGERLVWGSHNSCVSLLEGSLGTIRREGDILVIDLELGVGEEVRIPFFFVHLGREKGIDEYDCLAAEWLTLYESIIQEYKRFSRDYDPAARTVGMRTHEWRIDKAFLWSLVTLEDFSFYSVAPGEHYIDVERALWTLLGLSSSGQFLEARDLLELVASLYCPVNKRLPSHIHEDHTRHVSDVVDPLFLIALHDYAAHSLDKSLEKTLSSVVSRIVESGVALSKEEKPLSELFSSSSPVTSGFLWAHALSLAGKKAASKRMLERVKKEFWSSEDGLYTSTPGNDGDPVPSLVACFFGVLPFHEGKKILSRIRQEYTCSFGIKSSSFFSKEHRAGEPGKGAVSLFATILGSGAFLNYGMIDTGLELLYTASNHIYSSYVGRFPEFVSAARGEPTRHSVSVDSSALFARVVDSYLFGLVPRLEHGKPVLLVSPVIVSSWKQWERFGKQIGDNTLRIFISRIGDSRDYSLEMLFSDVFDGEVRIFPPSWTRRIIVDGEHDYEPETLSLKSFKKKRIVFKGP